MQSSLKCKLTDEEKVFIIESYKDKSFGLIAIELRKSKSTIYSFWKKWSNTRKIANIPPIGRRKFIIGRRQMKIIKRYMTKNKDSTLKSAIRLFGLTCSNVTLSKLLRKEKIGNYREIVKDKLTPRIMKNRVEFAEMYRRWSYNQWKKVVFWDSSSIELGKVYRKRIWRQRSDKSYTENKRRYIKVYIRMFGAVSFYGKSKLILLTNRFTNRNFIEFLNLHWNDIFDGVRPNLTGKCYILQDNEKPQISEEAKRYFSRKKIDIFPNYPAKSGDINIIENVWYTLKKEIYRHNIKTTEELEFIAQKCWDEIPQTYIQSLVKSMNKRLNSIINLKGKFSKY